VSELERVLLEAPLGRRRLLGGTLGGVRSTAAVDTGNRTVAEDIKAAITYAADTVAEKQTPRRKSRA
jgi:hypothetical protein